MLKTEKLTLTLAFTEQLGNSSVGQGSQWLCVLGGLGL